MYTCRCLKLLFIAMLTIGYNYWHDVSSILVKTVRTNIFAKNCMLHKFAITNTIFVKSIISDMHHHKTFMLSIFSKIRFVDQSKPCTQIYLPKNCKLHKFATTNSVFKKIHFLDMHHHKTYMYINFQQNRANRSVTTVHTNLFAEKSQAA